MATHKIAVARQTAGESHKQSGLLMQVTAETTGFIIIKRKTTPGRGKGRIYSTEAQRIPASLRQGDIFLRGTGTRNRGILGRKKRGNAPLSSWSVGHQCDSHTSVTIKKKTTHFALLKKIHAPQDEACLLTDAWRFPYFLFLSFAMHRVSSFHFNCFAHPSASQRCDRKKEKSAALPSAFSQLARHKASLCATLSPSKTRRADPLGRGDDSSFFPIATEATESSFFSFSLSKAE